VLGLPLGSGSEQAAAGRGSSSAPAPGDPEPEWLGLPPFAEVAGTALGLEYGGDQIWAAVGAGTPSARPPRDIWPWVWIPTVVALPFLLHSKSGSSSGDHGGTPPGGAGGGGFSGGELTPTPFPDAPPAPSAVPGSDTASQGAPDGGPGELSNLPDLPATQRAARIGEPLELPAAPAETLGFAGAGDFGLSSHAPATGLGARGGESLLASIEPRGTAPIPEPTSILLFGAGVLVVGLALRRAR